MVTSTKRPGLRGRGKYVPLAERVGEQAALLDINGSVIPHISTLVPLRSGFLVLKKYFIRNKLGR